MSRCYLLMAALAGVLSGCEIYPCVCSCIPDGGGNAVNIDTSTCSPSAFIAPNISKVNCPAGFRQGSCACSDNPGEGCDTIGPVGLAPVPEDAASPVNATR